MSDPIQAAFEQLTGLPAWLVQKGHASCLTFEFGQPHLEVREAKSSSAESERVRRRFSRRKVTPRGEWHLWIYCCHWRVILSANEIAHSESPDDEIRRAAAELDGQLLTGVAIDRSNRTSEFHFEYGAVIQMWPYGEDDREQWMLFMPSGDVLVYRGDGLYSLGPGNLPPDKVQWLALPS